MNKGDEYFALGVIDVLRTGNTRSDLKACEDDGGMLCLLVMKKYDWIMFLQVVSCSRLSILFDDFIDVGVG